MCVDTTEGGEKEPYTKIIHIVGKQALKVGEEDVPNMLVLPKGKPVDVCKVDATPTTAIEDEKIVVVDLHSVQKSESKLIEQPLSDEDEPGPKMPTPVERMTRARAREVAEESPLLQLQKKKTAQAKQKVGGAEIGALEISSIGPLGNVGSVCPSMYCTSHCGVHFN